MQHGAANTHLYLPNPFKQNVSVRAFEDKTFYAVDKQVFAANNTRYVST